ncbi:hypothetical protein KVT40_008364 [Elsinoe batatas]|uniref:Uncharacterized protein n=1 Tax=Elsinoe batatas TaxID=2601811 RepID=A0A8K0KVI1_9PEZI|nr:hypothetical protein KVT40_008364 [Elsinoe batatas]
MSTSRLPDIFPPSIADDDGHIWRYRAPASSDKEQVPRGPFENFQRMVFSKDLKLCILYYNDTHAPDEWTVADCIIFERQHLLPILWRMYSDDTIILLHIRDPLCRGYDAGLAAIVQENIASKVRLHLIATSRYMPLAVRFVAYRASPAGSPSRYMALEDMNTIQDSLERDRKVRAALFDDEPVAGSTVTGARNIPDGQLWAEWRRLYANELDEAARPGSTNYSEGRKLAVWRELFGDDDGLAGQLDDFVKKRDRELGRR